MRSLAARCAAALLGVLAVLLAVALPAGAHVDLDPGQAEAGSTVTLTFSFRHGKDGAATTGLAVQVPDGAEIVEVPATAGWTSTVDEAGTVVSWSGGSVPDGTEAAFPVVVRLPRREGEVRFPTIQTTEAGELAWISAGGGESEDDQPAPRLVLTPAGGSTSSSAVDRESTTTRAPRDLPRTILEVEQRDDGGASALPWILSGVAAVVAIGIGGTILSRRSGS
ncbi:MAG TPA: DUF1775 domain-containing protein [Acidimicrobiales bacterium]|nr:DUF1775 domain-containing protein [Acidimicrobiales bacterium]